MKHPELPDDATARLEAYHGLLLRYRSTLDLMSEAGLDDWDGHVAGALDVAAALVPPLEGSGRPVRTVLDVGSGAGLPGVVVAIARPDLDVHLVERRRRRGSFLTLVRGALELERVTVHGADVTALSRADVSPAGADAITAQAVAPFERIYAWTCPLHAPEVRFVSRKGEAWNADLEALARRLGTDLDAHSSPTRPRGTLVRFDAPGGRACRSSA